MKQTPQKWISGLDSLRFILALIVLLSHFEFPLNYYLRNHSAQFYRVLGMLIPNLFNGISAVIAFFIISGIVIHYPNRQGIKNLKGYYIRRFIRVLIPLFIALIVAHNFGIMHLVPVWSIYCELFYYFFYPIFFQLLQKRFWLFFWASFSFSYGLIFLFAKSDILSMILQRDVGYVAGYWQAGPLITWLIGLPCWLLGVAIANGNFLEQIRMSKFNIWYVRIFIYSLSIILNVINFHLFVPFIFSMNLFAFVLAFWIKLEIAESSKVKPNRLLEFGGKFSYSLYLIHGIAVFFLSKLLGTSSFIYFIVLFFTLLSAYVFYRIFEQPSHNLARSLGKL